MYFKGANLSKIGNFLNDEINERSFSNPHFRIKTKAASGYDMVTYNSGNIRHDIFQNRIIFAVNAIICIGSDSSFQIDSFESPKQR